MKNVLNILTLILCFQSFLFAQQGFYSVAKIPEELKKDAGSVIRYSNTVFTVKSAAEAVLEEKFVITILHESHRNQSYFVEHFDKLLKLTSIQISLYDRYGQLIKKVPKSDIHEKSVIGDGTLFDDNKIKVYTPDCHEYPYTIEYSFKRTYKGILMYPSYRTLNDYNMSLQVGRFKVVVPSGMELRYLMLNWNESPQMLTTEEGTSYQWDFENIPAIQYESFDAEFTDLVPVIWVAPSDFEMEGYPGNASSWSDLGKWIYDLNQGRDELSETTQGEVLSLVKEVPDRREQVKRIYEYMQHKTRYVNVSIGIGGWQPFPAEHVEENGYGDCKALSNYMFSLLKVADIPSFYTIIRAGDDAIPIDVDFPSQQFNHVILCVPNGQDSLWLECTSQLNPFNYLSSFTENRYALLVNSQGGHLVKTPAHTEVNNLRVRKATVTIDGQGYASAYVSNIYKGLFYDNMLSVYYTEGKRRMDQVRRRIHIKHFSLQDQDYKLTEYRADWPVLTEDYLIEANRYVKKMGDRFIFDVNFFNTSVDIPSSTNKQYSDLHLKEASTRIDSIKFVIPFGFYVKSYPENDTLVSDFGSFYTTYNLEGNILYCTRKQISQPGVFPNDRYIELRSYFKQISQADNQKVLVLPLE